MSIFFDDKLYSFDVSKIEVFIIKNIYLKKINKEFYTKTINWNFELKNEIFFSMCEFYA